MPGKVPERWEKYDAYKSSIKGTRFIAFKVPLEQRICQRLPKEFWLTPDNLIKSLEKDNFKIGIVIDLTNTKRYYKVTEVESLGVKYAKINTEGRIVPTLEVQEKFAQIVNSFLEENADNDLLVGVHCTHGLNRTGYMVCRYMINHMNFNPKDAIDAFNEARGYTIERENYIEDLMNISRDPDSADKVSDGEIVEDEDSESGLTSSNKEEGSSPVRPPPPEVTPHPEPFPPPPNEFAPREGGNGYFRGRYNNDFRGRGFQRRPFNNRGFPNNYNRGFDRGGFNNFGGRGNFRGGFPPRPGGYEPWMDEDLDDEDTEVIITETERGTIVREERPKSDRRMSDEFGHGRGRFPGERFPKPGFGLERRRPPGSPGRGAPPGFEPELEDEIPGRRFHEEGDTGRRGSWRGRGTYETGRGRGMDSWEPKRDYEFTGRGRGRPGYEDEPPQRKSFEGGRGKLYEEKRVHDYDEPPVGRGRGFYERDVYEGRGRGRGFEGHGRGYEKEEWARESEFTESRKYKFRPDSEGEAVPTKRFRRSFSPEGSGRRSWSPDEPKAYRTRESSSRGRGYETYSEGYSGGRGEGRGGFSDRGRLRQVSPSFERENPKEYRPKPRITGYSSGLSPGPSFPEESARFKERGDRSFHSREDSPPPTFRKKFQEDSPPPTFRKKLPAKYRKASSDFDDEEITFKKRPGAYEDSFPGRGREISRGSRARAGSFHAEDSDDSPPPPRRRITPPAQYRDPEPGEDSPPFRDDSPPFRGESVFRGREESFRGRGRAETFRGRGYTRSGIY